MPASHPFSAPRSPSSDVVISVENLSKSYLIGHDGPQERYHSLRDTLVRHGKNYVRKAVDMARGRQIIQGDTVEEFWALKDVSFEVKRGEVLGIIGRNGAGKSTLLKVLSRITEPTSGRVVLDGRVASLLEVGTGFHPELTGRENIFLNGAILGMGKVEIRKKFDEIVDFAEVEKFLDTPVKRYSSGMYVRLAFAVAAHLEPEILIIDEVLAVGDAQFQKKCLGKMKDVAGEGRTVLFVSHNMAAVNDLTSKAILLSDGNILYQGGTRDCVIKYLENGGETSTEFERIHPTSEAPCVLSARVITSPLGGSHYSGNDLNLEFKINGGYLKRNLYFSFQIVNQYQQKVIHCWEYNILGGNNEICVKFSLPDLRLNVGSYHIATYISGPPGSKMEEALEGICNFNVEVIREQTLFGWRPEACVYLQDFRSEIVIL